MTNSDHLSAEETEAWEFAYAEIESTVRRRRKRFALGLAALGGWLTVTSMLFARFREVIVEAWASGGFVWLSPGLAWWMILVTSYGTALVVLGSALRVWLRRDPSPGEIFRLMEER